jgi:hypothetical protein
MDKTLRSQYTAASGPYPLAEIPSSPAPPVIMQGASVHAAEIPADSRLHSAAAAAYFHDAFAIPVANDDRTAMALYLAAVAGTPRWVDLLMTMRNRVVSLFGLKDVGHLGNIDPHKAPADYQPGDRVGIFTLLSITDQEVVLGDADKHLDAQLSLYRHAGAQPKVTVSTVVHVHNRLGRLYLFFVIPVHKIIVPAMLARSFGKRPA